MAAGGSSEKCGRGSEVRLRRGRPAQRQMVSITPLNGLHGSWPGVLRAPEAEQGWRPWSLSAFSLSPLEGCGPRPREALSMVRRRAAAGPIRSTLSSPGSYSPTFRLFPSHWLFGRPAPVVPFSFLGFRLLFFLLLLVFLPFPHRPVRPPCLSPDSGVSELLD